MLLSYLIFDCVCLTLSLADTHGIAKYARTYRTREFQTQLLHYFSKSDNKSNHYRVIFTHQFSPACFHSPIFTRLFSPTNFHKALFIYQVGENEIVTPWAIRNEIFIHRMKKWVKMAFAPKYWVKMQISTPQKWVKSQGEFYHWVDPQWLIEYSLVFLST